MFEELLLHRRLEEETDFLPFISVEEEVEDKNEFIPDELPILALDFGRHIVHRVELPIFVLDFGLTGTGGDNLTIT